MTASARGSVLACVRRTLRERDLVRSGQHVLVACSGGGDSVALAHVLATLRHELSISLSMATVDHGLRPEAAEEVAGVLALGERLGLPTEVLRVHVPEGNLQAGARRVRYRALLDLARRQGADRVATGHTMDDQAETVLSRLLQGATMAGLGAIQARRADGVVRPLIDCRRGDLRAYLVARGLRWAEDPSNEEPRFERIRRRTYLVGMEHEEPSIVPHLASIADEIRQMRRVVRQQAARVRRACAGSVGSLRRTELRVLDPAVRGELMRSWLRGKGLSMRRVHLEALERLVTDGRGEVLLGAGWGVRLVDGELRCERRSRRTRSRRGSPDD